MPHRCDGLCERQLSESMTALVAASTGQPKQEAAPIAPPPPPPCAPTFLDVSDTIPRDAKSEGCCGAGKDLPQVSAALQPPGDELAPTLGIGRA